MLEQINELDRRWLLVVNSHHNAFWDTVMWFASGDTSWIPFYALLLLLIIFKMKRQSWLLILMVVPLIVASDQLASHLIKPMVHRLRPSHTPGLEEQLRYLHNYQGGTYGFISSHACNVFALAAYLSLTIGRKIKWLPWVLFPWAIIVSYSRVYLGVHYTTDVVVAAILGIMIALQIAWLYALLFQYFFISKTNLSCG